MSLDPTLLSAIGEAAESTGMPAGLIRAIVERESVGDVLAWRVEPPYRYLWDWEAGTPFRRLTRAEIDSERAPEDFTHPRYCSRDTEWWGQQASWGPMQVMGAVARECGYRDPFPGLCRARAGVGIGATHMADLAERFNPRYGWEGVVAAYNAGSPRRREDGAWVNQGYVTHVMQLWGGA